VRAITAALVLSVLAPSAVATNSSHQHQHRHHNGIVHKAPKTPGTNINDLVRAISKSREFPLDPTLRKLPIKQRRNATCLALAIYHEARSSSEPDKKGVAHVVVNRLKSGGFGRTVCDVVNERLPHVTIPQFSWLLEHQKALLPTEDDAWLEAQQIALSVLNSHSEDPSKGSTYFWALNMTKHQSWMRTGKAYYHIGSHVFMVGR
jgi:spore germination cell wall hydrolase CwlJ-like protein